MFQKIAFPSATFLILVQLIALSTQATPMDVTEAENFYDDLSKNWHFSCKIDSLSPTENSQFLEFYRTTAREAVIKGLNDLGAINPKLQKAVIRRTHGQSLDWGCDLKSFMNKSAAGYYGDFLIWQTGVQLTAAAVGYGLKCLSQNSSCLSFKGVLLHEFYHYAGLDNLIFTKHNHALDQVNTPDAKFNDVIYACTAQSFPNSLQPLESRANHAAYSNTKHICSLCAAAIPLWLRHGTHVPTDVMGGESVAPICANLDEQNFLAGWVETSADGQVHFETAESRRINEEINARYEKEIERINKNSELLRQMILKLYKNQ
jgi:hypothetical protein